MSHQCCLVLHKSEWDRLKRRKNPEKALPDRNEYFNSLTEQSQSWIKSWPDTVQGHVYQLEKQKEKEHQQQIETVKQFALKKKREIKIESLKRAKEMIFEDSCYGHQILSALIESKTLEERAEQVKFQKEVKQTAELQKQREPKETSLQSVTLNKENEKQMKLAKKEREIDVAQTNKEIAEKQKDKRVKEKELERNELIKDESLNNLIIKKEKTFKKDLQQELDVIKSYNNQMKILYNKKEEIEEVIRNIHTKYQNRIKLKEKIVFDKIHKEKYIKSQKVFEMVKNINDDKNKKYNEFIEKGIKRLTENIKKQEKADKENTIFKRNKRRSLAEENKTLAQYQQHIKLLENNKNICYRQNVISKSCYKQTKAYDDTDETTQITKPTLLVKIKERKQETRPWSGLNAAHTQFAEHANETLRRCQFKHKLLKVIEDYRKVNGLDSSTTPISD